MIYAMPIPKLHMLPLVASKKLMTYLTSNACQVSLSPGWLTWRCGSENPMCLRGVSPSSRHECRAYSALSNSMTVNGAWHVHTHTRHATPYKLV